MNTYLFIRGISFTEIERKGLKNDARQFEQNRKLFNVTKNETFYSLLWVIFTLNNYVPTIYIY